MSDPVKSSEIEDVLASIRRLVSEETRGEAQSLREDSPESEAAGQNDDPAKGVAPNALVLTPALRVHEGGRSDPAPEQDAAHPEKPVENASNEAELSEAESSQDGNDEAESAADSSEYASGENVDAEATVPKAVDDIEFNLPDLPDEAQTLETKIAALEALIANGIEDRSAGEVAEQSDDAHDDDNREASGRGATVADENDLSDDMTEAEDLPEPEETQEDLSDAGEPGVVFVDPTDTMPQAEAPEAEAAEVAAEVAVSQPEDPELSDTVEPNATAMQKTRAQTQDAATGDSTLLQSGEDAVAIDEAALRELVIDIVREELQGALGERITRNVRRLVRREIHRALATQELD